MTQELPELAETHVDAAVSELVDMAVEDGKSLRHMTDLVYTNEVCTPMMEDADIDAVFAVIDADDELDLGHLSANYDGYESSERAVRHHSALCLQQLVYDHLDVLLGETDE